MGRDFEGLLSATTHGELGSRIALGGSCLGKFLRRVLACGGEAAMAACACRLLGWPLFPVFLFRPEQDDAVPAPLLPLLRNPRILGPCGCFRRDEER